MTESLRKEMESLAEHKDGYSADAKAFADKNFICTPPCDSYGICENCAEEVCFASGYNFGVKAGFAAAIPLAQAEERERLAKLAPKFDELSASDFSNHAPIPLDLDVRLLQGARRQYALLAPVIGALLEENQGLTKDVVTLRKEAEKLCRMVAQMAAK